MVQAVETSSYHVALPGIRFNAWRWSPAGGMPAGGRRIVILHGVTSSALAFAGVARALAADGRTVDALDLPGHGGTRWTDGSGASLPDQESVGRSAYDLRHVGELVAAAMHGIPAAAMHALPAAEAEDLHLPAARPRAAVLAGAPALLGHSWGAGVATAAVDAGAAVAQLVLEDPPFLTAEQAAEMADGFRAELRPELDEARGVVRSWGPAWEGEDADARAQALVETSPLAADAIARGAPWDPLGLMTAWRRRHAGLRVDLIAGDARAGGRIPADMLPLLRDALGADHVHEMPGLGHSPHRDDPDQFLAILRRVLA